MAERGERALTATELVALSRVLNVSISDLFSGVEEDLDREVELKIYAAYRRGVLDTKSAVTKALSTALAAVEPNSETWDDAIEVTA